MSEKKEPVGIFNLALAFLVLGTFSLLITLPILISGNPPNSPPSPVTKGTVILNLIKFAIGCGTTGILILKKKKWTRVVSLIIVSIMIGLMGMDEMGSYVTSENILSGIRRSLGSTYAWVIAFFIYSIYYLTRPKVKEQFKGKG